MKLTERQRSLLYSPPSTMNGWDERVGAEVGQLIDAGLLKVEQRSVSHTYIYLHKTDAGRAALAESD